MKRIVFILAFLLCLLLVVAAAQADVTSAYVAGTTKTYADIYGLPYEPLTLGVDASGGTGALNYRWFYMVDGDQVVLQDGSSSAYTVPSLSGRQSITCFVSDETGRGLSVNFFTRVTNNLTASAETSMVYVHPYETAVLQTNADCDVGGLRYEWYYDGWEDETSNVFTRENVTGKSGSVFCNVYDDFGNQATARFYVYVDNELTAVDEVSGSYRWNTVSAPPNESVTLTVSANCLAGSLRYQWKGGPSTVSTTAIDGATAASYATEPKTEKTCYVCVVSDDFGNTASVDYTVNIDNRLRISRAEGYSWNITVAPGGSATMAAVASCLSGEVHYQWCTYENSEYIPIEGETDSVFTLDSVSSAATYYCQATDDYGSEPVQCSFRLEIDNAFFAAADGGEFITVPVNSTPTLKINAQCTTGEIHYQWFQNGGTSEDNTSSTYTAQPLKLNTKMIYCTVSDDYGNTTTIWYYITLDNALSARAAQYRVAVSPGGTAVLEVIASCNDGAITYSWEKLVEENGSTMNYYVDCDTATLVTDPVTKTTEYFCYVSDIYGNNTQVYFMVVIDNRLTAAADGDTSLTASYGDTVTLRVNADCAVGGLTYSWQVSSRDASGSYYRTVENAESDTLVTDPLIYKAYYYCTVTDEYGNSENVSWSVGIENHLTVSPAGEEIIISAPGEDVTLGVVVSADTTEGIAYQWYAVIFDTPGYQYYEGTSSYTRVIGSVSDTYSVTALSSNMKAYCQVNDQFGNSVRQFFTVLPENGPAAEEDFTWDTVGGNAVIRQYSGAGGVVRIPETLGGKPVTGIRNDAFYGNRTITAVTIPASVTAIGDSAFWACSYLEKITLPEGLTEIGESAFGATKITRLDIPASVTSVSGNIAYSNSMLQQVNVADGNTAYVSADGVLFTADMTQLICCPAARTGTYTVPDGVTAVGSRAFYSSSLGTVVLPESLQTLGDYAFCGARITGITLPDGISGIGEGAFYAAKLRSVVIPEGVTAIPDRMFGECDSLTAVTLPEQIETIGENAFSRCSALADVYYGGTEEQWADIGIGSGNTALLEAEVHFGGAEPEIVDSGTWGNNLAWTLDEKGLLKITGEGEMDHFLNFGGTDAWHAHKSGVVRIEVGEGITSLGYRAFEGFSALERISLPDSLTTMTEWSVNGCRKLTSITIPANVTEIGRLAVCNNASLTEINVAEENSVFASEDGVLFNKDMTTLIYYPNGKAGVYTIPDGVRSIGEQAFYWSHEITGVIIPASVTEIGANAFQTCSQLADVVIPEGVTAIPDYTFANAAGLHSVTIPASVTEIGANAFSNAGLEEVWFGGSEIRWKQVSVAGNNQPLLDAEIHYAEESRILELPGDLKTIEAQAFLNLESAEAVRIPDGVTSIADDAFDKDMVIIAPAGSFAITWAEANNMAYIEE